MQLRDDMVGYMQDREARAHITERLLLSQSEACGRLGVSRLTLLGEIKAGRLRYVLVGKRRKFKPSDLEAYIERQATWDGNEGVWSGDAKAHRFGGPTSRSGENAFERALRGLTRTRPS